jgi:hypothetical protein
MKFPKKTMYTLLLPEAVLVFAFPKVYNAEPDAAHPQRWHRGCH